MPGEVFARLRKALKCDNPDDDDRVEELIYQAELAWGRGEYGNCGRILAVLGF